MAGPKTASLGRLITGIGVLWMAWAVFTGLVELGGELENLGVPFLPGLLIFFVGRFMTRIGRRRPLPDDESPWQEPQVGMRAPEARRPRPVTRPEPEVGPEPEPDTPAGPLPNLTNLEAEILEPPPRMTSEEMVAEARRRFGPRRIEDDERNH